MALRSMTVHRYEEIRQRLAEGRSLREIARALGCSRRTVRDVRDGERVSPDAPKGLSDPLWMVQVDWPAIIHDLGLGHPLKFLWEERAQHLITYPNFWKQFYRKFPQYRAASVTAREFEPGERVEVDYAGDPIEWLEIKTGEIRKAWIFVACLGFSQLLFAWAAEDMKSRNWLGSHRRMFSYYGGVPHVTVPDCLKQGVLKCHLCGDEFVILLAEVAHEQDAAVGAEKLLQSIRMPHTLHENEVHVTASIGIVVHPYDGTTVELLLDHADTAMYEAKRLGRNNYQFYRADLNASAIERQGLEGGLRHAVERQELQLHYQPIMDLSTGTIAGVEALIRWQHPTMGVILPDRFIPVAEESGLIVPIGQWVLREA